MDEKYEENDVIDYESDEETKKKKVDNDSESDSEDDDKSVASSDADTNSDQDSEPESDGDDEDTDKTKTIFEKMNKKAEPSKYIQYAISDDEDENYDEDDDDEDENYLQKFDESLKQNVIVDNHPEMQQHNYDEIEALSVIVRDNHGNIIDPLHKTLPFLTKYEKARILGERAKQINAGGSPFVKVESNVIDGYLIALSELEQKAIPFILKRPLPNGGCEYWKLRDLEILV